MDELRFKSNNKIVLITPYFGKFPQWFDLYLYSCSRQKNIDFVYFTDCELPQKVYQNTIFIPTTFQEYCDKVSKSLEIDFHPNESYKLCDVKPFYGIIHNDLINRYDFWGFADIDLIFGDLSIIINEQKLTDYDFITTHTNRVAGHLALVRSKSSFTTSCLNIPDWKNKLQCQEHISVDEDDWALLLYPQLKWISRFYRHICRRLHIPMKYCYEGIVNKVFCNKYTRRSFYEYGTTPLPQNGQKWLFNPNEGTMTNPSGKEIPYLHFLFFKKNRYKKTDVYWKDDYVKVSAPYTSVITITNEGING